MLQVYLYLYFVPLYLETYIDSASCAGRLVFTYRCAFKPQKVQKNITFQ